MSTFGLVFSVMTPLSLILLWPWHQCRHWLRAIAPWTALPALLTALSAAGDVQLRLPWLLTGGDWGLSPMSRAFLGFSALLWLVAGLFSQGYMAGDKALDRYWLLWLLTMAGNLGLIVAQDVVSFYTFFALMTFAAYGLVIHDGQNSSRYAGRVYLIMAVIGEGFILTGLIYACALTTSFTLAALPAALAQDPNGSWVALLLWLGFGVKAGLPLLHFWLALAHPAAPVPASAVLSGAMIKAGLLGWLVTLPFGLAVMAWSEMVMIAGFAAAFGAAMVGITQTAPKSVLAYSSISQMGLMTVIVGAMLQLPDRQFLLMPVVVLFALHHGLAKGALFLGVGAAHRFGQRWPLSVWAGLWLPALVLAGLPFSSGAAAKLAFKGALGDVTPATFWWQQVPLLFSLASIGTTLLMARFLWCLRAEFGQHPVSDLLTGGAWVISVAASVAGWLLLPLPSLPLPLTWTLSKVLSSLWPMAIGVSLAWVAIRWKLRNVAIPAGDLLRQVEMILGAIHMIARHLATPLKVGLSRLLFWLKVGRLQLHKQLVHSHYVETLWRREAALLFVLICLLAILTLKFPLI